MPFLRSLQAAFKRTGTPRLVLLRSGRPRQAVAGTGHPLGAATVVDPQLASAAVARLVAVTDEATRALGDRHEIHIATFPFKVGRESRSPHLAFRPALFERRIGEAPQLNDLYLMESPCTDLFHISSEHFLIDRVGDQFFVVDRGSVCGTIVAGKQIGGSRTGGQTELRHGDVIMVGTSISEYAFRFEVMLSDQTASMTRTAIDDHEINDGITHNRWR